MLYFFLALCRTKMLADGQNLEADLAAESWIAASEDLNQSPELGRSMWEEINKIMNEADRDRDGKLDKSELISIIKKRSP